MLKADNIASIRQYYLASCITLFLIALLIIRFFQLQIVDHDQYSKKANTNRIRKVTSSAPRGLILDRNGQILVDNPEAIEALDRMVKAQKHDPEAWDKFLKKNASHEINKVLF